MTSPSLSWHPQAWGFSDSLPTRMSIRSLWGLERVPCCMEVGRAHISHLDLAASVPRPGLHSIQLPQFWGRSLWSTSARPHSLAPSWRSLALPPLSLGHPAFLSQLPGFIMTGDSTLLVHCVSVSLSTCFAGLLRRKVIRKVSFPISNWDHSQEFFKSVFGTLQQRCFYKT